jgi:hypothetical protein
MADGPIPLKPKTTKPPEDALDIDSLWLDPALGDGLINVHYHNIPVDKPKNFFRVNPDPAYRRLTEIYVHKVEDQIEEQTYIVDKSMRGVIDEVRRATLVTVVYRDGSPRLWPLKLPKDGERDNEAWVSARAAAKTAMTKWVRLVWQKRTYLTREAQPGYAPEPDWSKLPSFDELVRLGFGESGIIRGHDHPVVRDLFGAAPAKSDDDDDDLS